MARISTKDMVPLCRQLATSYDAGIPILKGLELLERNASSPNTRNILGEMRASIKAGATLADAARGQQQSLPPFFIELLASGEHGGKLDVMLRDLATYYEDRLRMNRAIIGSLAYPAFLLCAAWFLGSFSIGIIGHISFDARSTFSLSEYFNEWLRLQGEALVVFGGTAAGVYLLRGTGIPQRAWGAFTARTWPFRNVTRKFALARFFRSLALLLGAGVNIKHAIHSAAQTAVNPFVRDDLLRALPVVSRGGTLQEAFAQCRTLTPVSREMITVGEVSGNLEGQLKKVSEYHFDEAQLATRIALRVLNIGLLLTVGGVVGYVVISFYSRLFSLYDTIH